MRTTATTAEQTAFADRTDEPEAEHGAAADQDEGEQAENSPRSRRDTAPVSVSPKSMRRYRSCYTGRAEREIESSVVSRDCTPVAFPASSSRRTIDLNWP